MKERTFTYFPEIKTCPICNTNTDKETCLVPIDGTEDGKICEAAPVHVECIKQISMFRYNREHGIIYRKI